MTRVQAYQAMTDYETALRTYLQAEAAMLKAKDALQTVLHEAYPLPVHSCQHGFETAVCAVCRP